MEEKTCDSDRTTVTRRAFLEKLAVASAALGAVSMICRARSVCEASAASRGHRSENVSIHMDQPYIDSTGRATPYHPPRGMRSGSPVAHLTEEAFRSMCCYA